MYRSKKLSDGTHPIVLRINERGSRFIVTLPFSCKEYEWNDKKSIFTSKYDDCDYATQRLRKYYARAIRAVDKFNDEGISYTNKDLFKSLVLEGEQKKQKDTMSIHAFLDRYIERLGTNRQFDTRDNFKTLRSRLFGSNRCKPFFKKDKLFSELSVADLKNYIAHLRDDGVKGAIRNYMKDFRTLYNDAEEEDVFVLVKNPFKRINFGEFTTEYNPRGLSLESVKKLLAYKPSEELYLDYYVFLLAYYGAGIRFNDLCHLEYSKHIIGGEREQGFLGGKIVYIAKKTNKQMPPIEIDENLAYIITQLDTGTEYVCPFFNERHITEKQKYNRRRKCNKQYNYNLKKIQALAEIDEDITSHVARHSIANVLVEMGASIRDIQSVYNHQRADTTRHYLESLGYNQISEVHKKLRV